jgi:ribosomal protein S18 acetylase RimI-like enzyme
VTGPAVEMMRNRADAAQVAEHLRACDAGFVPPLGDRVDLDVYAEKIVQRAERFEAWSGEQLAGLVAAYCNDDGRQTAFVTNVSVLPPRRGGGIAQRLLRACVAFVRDAGFERIELEVDPRNSAATLLYRKLGFEVTRADERSQTMHLIV